MRIIMNIGAIIKDTIDLRLKELDTLTLNDQVSYSCIREMLCVTNDELVFSILSISQILCPIIIE